jgi:hypothetical protein
MEVGRQTSHDGEHLADQLWVARCELRSIATDRGS